MSLLFEPPTIHLHSQQITPIPSHQKEAAADTGQLSPSHRQPLKLPTFAATCRPILRQPLSPLLSRASSLAFSGNGGFLTILSSSSTSSFSWLLNRLRFPSKQNSRAPPPLLQPYVSFPVETPAPPPTPPFRTKFSEGLSIRSSFLVSSALRPTPFLAPPSSLPETALSKVNNDVYVWPSCHLASRPHQTLLTIFSLKHCLLCVSRTPHFCCPDDKVEPPQARSQTLSSPLVPYVISSILVAPVTYRKISSFTLHRGPRSELLPCAASNPAGGPTKHRKGIQARSLDSVLSQAHRLCEWSRHPSPLNSQKPRGHL